MSKIQINELIKALANVPNCLSEKSLLPGKFQKTILQNLDPSETTVAVYSDNLISDPDKWNDVKGSIDTSVRGAGIGQTVGTEALAWYLSFHHDQNKWGIYIPISSLHYLNEVLQIRVHSQVNLGLISKNLLLSHELYHFLTDIAISQFELLTNHPIYRDHKKLYKHENFPLISDEDYSYLEENLANAFMLGEMQSQISDHQLQKIVSWVETMPPGYREGAATFLNLDRNNLEKENLNRYFGITAAKTQLNIVEQALDLSVFIPNPVKEIVDQCPIYILDDTQDTGLDPDIVRFFQRIEEIHETKAFKKMLAKIPDKIQSAWVETKEKLKYSIPKSLKFRKFKEYYSINLPDGYRAHFDKPIKKEKTWVALEIGDHRSMGHGK